MKAVRGIAPYLTLLLVVAWLLAACGSGSGACVATGGVLSSPACKQDWERAECDDWNSQQVNGSSWTFHGGEACAALGYTERCSDGSYRRPGAC